MGMSTPAFLTLEPAFLSVLSGPDQRAGILFYLLGGRSATVLSGKTGGMALREPFLGPAQFSVVIFPFIRYNIFDKERKFVGYLTVWYHIFRIRRRTMSNYVISISREFGSGGRLIGKRLAAQLGIPCYDRTIIQKTAEKSGLSPDFIARAEERARSRFHMSIAPIGIGAPTMSSHGIPVSHQAFFAQSDVIRELADQGPCVIVGRCSDYVLGDRDNCLKVFIHADLASRVRRCVEEDHIPQDDMERRVVQMDRGRANYYNYYTGHNWGEMRRYDLTINSSTVGVEGAVDLIADMVRHREAQHV